MTELRTDLPVQVENGDAVVAGTQEARAGCPHLGTCGGCMFPHEPYDAYARAKAERLNGLLEAEIGLPIESLKSYARSSRRRVTFTAEKAGRDVTLGLHAARSHSLVDIEVCPVVLPELSNLLPWLREMLQATLASNGKARVHLTRASNGIDCVIDGSRLPPKSAAAVVGFLSGSDVIRVVWNGETVISKEVPQVEFGGVAVALPPSSFLQAVQACETDMVKFAKNALRQVKAERGPVCDLFCGLGAFTFPCAKLASVSAFEQDGQAIQAMQAATRKAKGIKPVTALQRDLFRNPLGRIELNGFAAAIVNPPREGAEAQFKALAASNIDAVIAISCNPISFLKDVKHLTSNGFVVTKLAGFDQFAFSNHVEIAALCVRAEDGKQKRRTQARLR